MPTSPDFAVRCIDCGHMAGQHGGPSNHGGCDACNQDPTITLGMVCHLNAWEAVSRTLRQRLDTVRAIHKREAVFGMHPLYICSTCGLNWPCPTIQAVDGEENA